MKAHGERVTTRVKETEKKTSAKCLLCDEEYETQRCKFLSICRILALEHSKPSKGYLFDLLRDFLNTDEKGGDLGLVCN